ncbi:MAG TPA: hypothetical protein VGP36_17135 [Mycobacteriales bacterium]|jgi:hypothetical protein|nr:hypothetical protein [Mycobacteriales bacterium]
MLKSPRPPSFAERNWWLTVAFGVVLLAIGAGWAVRGSAVYAVLFALVGAAEIVLGLKNKR